MNQAGLGSTTVCQIGIVVADIEAAIDRYCRIFGVERPRVIVTEGYTAAKTTYEGQPTEARAKLAFFDMGQVAIELIEPIDGPSTWREFLDEKGEGVHHIAFRIKGTDQVVAFLEGEGIPVSQFGYYTGGMYTYLRSEPVLGVAVELLEDLR